MIDPPAANALQRAIDRALPLVAERLARYPTSPQLERTDPRGTA